MAEMIDGRKIAQRIEEKLREKINSLDKKLKLKIFLAGEDPASQIYVQKKKDFCQRVGILAEVEKLGEEISQEEFNDICFFFYENDLKATEDSLKDIIEMYTKEYMLRRIN